MGRCLLIVCRRIFGNWVNGCVVIRLSVIVCMMLICWSMFWWWIFMVIGFMFRSMLCLS